MKAYQAFHPLPQVAFNRGRFEGLPHKPTIAAKYAAIVATTRRLSFPACNETDASLTFPTFVERNVCFYGQGPLIRLNSREKRPISRPGSAASADPGFFPGCSKLPTTT